MKRKGEWHSAWGSAVEDRRCERGHKQASKSLQGAHSLCLDLLAASMTSRRPARPFAAWGGRRRLVTTNAKSKKIQN